jgi:large subunit ribosomal protein L6
MARIGKMPIIIPAGVKLDLADGILQVTGPKGTLKQEIMGPIELDLNETQLVVKRKDSSKNANARQGLYRALISNMIHGVTKGYKKVLIIKGVGYRAEVKGKEIILTLGYSHQIKYQLPENIEAEDQDRMTKLIIRGVDKQLVGQVAAQIRDFRHPDSYKGKGIQYEGERIILKAGKAGQKT